MHDTVIIHQKDRPRLIQSKSNALAALDLKDPALSAFDTLSGNQDHSDKVYSVSVRALRRWASDTSNGFYPKLVRLAVQSLCAGTWRKKSGHPTD
jgi:hypothetical protein